MGPVIPLICEHLARIAVLQGVLFLCRLLFLKPKYCKGYLTMLLCTCVRSHGHREESRPGRQDRKKGIDEEEARRVYAVLVFLEDHEEVL